MGLEITEPLREIIIIAVRVLERGPTFTTRVAPAMYTEDLQTAGTRLRERASTLGEELDESTLYIIARGVGIRESARHAITPCLPCERCERERL